MNSKNLLIRASAGTGKTYSLATRFIELMQLGVRPSAIVALTFSRAAAQEIYVKLLKRLCEAAKSDKRFQAMLRDVVTAQHLGTIATIDSFILRLVRNYPLELGFQNAVGVLDEYAQQDEIAAALDALLGKTAEDPAFCAAVKDFDEGTFPRECRARLQKLLDGSLRIFALDHRAQTFDEDSMAGALGIPRAPSFADQPPATAAVSCGEQDKMVEEAYAKFRDACAAYEGDSWYAPTSPKALVALVDAFRADPSADEYAFDYRRRQIVAKFPPAAAAAIHADLDRMTALYFRARIRTAAKKLRLLAEVEKTYDRRTRRAGKLTFDDLGRVRREFEAGGRALAVENLEYRFDSTFSHWALDEFQDTSAVQWACLHDLVRNAAVDDEKSVMVVGDLKQAIYGWRGSDDRPFREIEGWPEISSSATIDWGSGASMRVGEIQNLDFSFRYGSAVCEFLNLLFSEEKRLDWVPHRARNAGGHVRVVVTPAPDETPDVPESEESDIPAIVRLMAPQIIKEIRPAWEQNRQAKEPQTFGVLVRSNKDGAALTRLLRAAGLEAEWEGISRILDVPAAHLALNLLRLAEHPDDVRAWESVSRTPLRELACPQGEDAAAVSRVVGTLLSKLGLARTLRTLLAPLQDEKAALDELSRLRLEELVRAAAQFEHLAKPTDGVEAFVRYLTLRQDRVNADSPEVIRVLTIHRSKGLTLGHVYVPFFETAKTDLKALDPSRDLLVDPEGSWAMAAPNAQAAQMFPRVAAAWQAACEKKYDEALHTCYVALTRVKHSMTVFLSGEALASTRPTLSRYLFERLAGTGAAEGVLYEVGTEFNWLDPQKKADEKTSNKKPDEPAPDWDYSGDEAAASPRRRSPSALGKLSASAGGVAALFAEHSGEAAQKGRDLHAEYERIEWMEAAEARDDFERALVRPSPAATLWRERSYEISRGGVWETGQFDRVVFTGEGEARRARVQDFKTNRPFRGEDAAAFIERMRACYAEQMRSYREAVSALTGIPLKNISSELLLAVPQAVVRL